MKNILSQPNRDVLREFVCSRMLVALDFDGTLAPIVADPDRAKMRAPTRRLLGKLAAIYPVVVISGRAQPDVQHKLGGVAVREVIGNHGMEPWHASQRFAAEVERWIPLLSAATASFKGVVIENKIYSVAVHYRRSREKKAARAAIVKATHQLGDVRIIGGKLVVNVLPHGAPHKGVALERARTRLRCDTAIYVGDDVTDEDVFALDRPGRLLTVRVGRRRDSAATYYLSNQAAIDDLLEILIEHRQNARQRVGPVR